MAQTPEGRVKDKIKAWLRSRGIWFFMPVTGGYGRNGVHDFVCCAPVLITQEMVGKTVGMFLTIETKAEGKLKRGLFLSDPLDVPDTIPNVTQGQRDMAVEICKASGLVIAVDDVNQLTGEKVYEFLRRS
jgi:ribosomal protein S19